MEVPGVLIEWMALRAESDVDLATLSNVSRTWRHHVREAILGAATPISLLLPSMIRHARSKKRESSSSDSFCAAWFHPGGVQTVQVTSKPVDEDHLHKRQKSGNRDCCYEWRGYRHAVDVLMPFGYSPHFIQSVLMEETAGKYSEPTVAVRGSTFARPEGYCTCWDDEGQEHYNKYSQIIRQQQRIMLQRQMLPRAIQTPQRSPTAARTTAIQFLNASGTNAVRLLTAPFACGPLVQNMTLFIVSIATEDGCFCSGLKRRCEFGHFYPQSNRDHLIDMSSICIATNVVDDDDGGDSSDDDEDVNNAGQKKRDDDEDDEGESQDAGFRHRSLSVHGSCSCPFNPNAELFETAAEHEQDAKPPDALHRGQLGPGQWHLYVALVDGSNATIRVDGVTEPMVHLSRGAGSNSNDNQGAASRTGHVQLDGLTIGSDHSFDMSLCFGEGGPGEGEGSIAELAVFQGTLPLADVQAMERHLMRKHCIEPTEPGRVELVRQEDEWKRYSRALIEQGAPYSMVVPEGVPLRIVAKDPSVSWHRTNAVTGDDIRVGRIGSRLSTGSSDW